MIYGWSPGIGDPSIMGWATVAGYLVGAALSARAAATASHRRNGREVAFWWITAAALLALAVNKELDLQSLLTAVGRHVAMTQGWYDARREVQLLFIATVAAAGLVAALLMLRLARRSDPAVRAGLAGLVFIGGFVVIRAASFHDIDHWLGTGPLALRWNWILELGGIAIVATAALLYARKSGRQQRRRRSSAS